MKSRRPHSKLPQGTARWGILFFLIGLELVLLGFLHVVQPAVSHAFLIKKGPDYVVFWSKDGHYDSVVYRDLRSALSFAKKDLGLVEGTSSQGMDIERLWTQDRFGSFVVMWKTFRYPHLNHLTFQKESEAKFFEAAFRSGSYTPSPFGHSVLLLPSQRQ